MYEVAVLGAGIVGVSTAINVQKKFPAAKVRLISDRFDQDTTSWGAGGVFVPEAVLIHGLSTERLRKWVKNSWEYYSSLASSENASVTGMQFVSGYCLYKNEPEIPVYAEFVNAFRKMTKNEINRLKFQEYHEDLLALGGIRQDNNYNMNNSKEDTEDILRRCQKLCPAVKGAKLDHVWTGLRPTRTPPRVESEILKLPEGNLKVVHNYGHGANGIVLSWGSSLEAADLVESCLKSTSKL
ncbi:hypothetical protein FSP39_021793 [Pinctada imbricata]|uniref:FAD dependent oxidoreductase domain-containing protein n=1 Tax=Pinctada imbricata TaxID=66713 RepID=A0AA88XJW1_PINIB|nr:hypothetical protein FSP39_021793 [Pinctada imbricata]